MRFSSVAAKKSAESCLEFSLEGQRGFPETKFGQHHQRDNAIILQKQFERSQYFIQLPGAIQACKIGKDEIERPLLTESPQAVERTNFLCYFIFKPACSYFRTKLRLHAVRNISGMYTMPSPREIDAVLTSTGI